MKTDAVPVLNMPPFLSAAEDNTNMLLYGVIVMGCLLVVLFLMLRRIKKLFSLFYIYQDLKKERITARQAAYAISKQTTDQTALADLKMPADDLNLISSLKYMKAFNADKMLLLNCIKRLMRLALSGKY
ncbi:MAG: hypothetical protein OEY11_14875 [Gammaproteobacteria bacterium]|nr:hypothetical protein [Gammaproteobacteria bacterium]